MVSINSLSPLYGSYRYKCSLCGAENGAISENNITKCPVCGAYLCRACSRHNFCGNHWDALPENIKHDLIGIENRTHQTAILGCILFIIASFSLFALLTWISLVTIGDLDDFQTPFFMIPLFGILIFVLPTKFNERSVQNNYRNSWKKQQFYFQKHGIFLHQFQIVSSGPPKGQMVTISFKPVNLPPEIFRGRLSSKSPYEVWCLTTIIIFFVILILLDVWNSQGDGPLYLFGL